MKNEWKSKLARCNEDLQAVFGMNGNEAFQQVWKLLKRHNHDVDTVRGVVIRMCREYYKQNPTMGLRHERGEK